MLFLKKNIIIIITMMELIMVAKIIAATNPEVCDRHCLRNYSCIIIFFFEGGYTVRHAVS